MADVTRDERTEGVRVLVIEDNFDSATTMAALLEIFGHAVEIAHDGRAGVERARESQPDVILCDIGLPGELDGYGVARALRAEPEVPFLVALTGYGLEEDRDRALAAGFDLHVTKPVRSGALEAAVRAAMDRRTAP